MSLRSIVNDMYRGFLIQTAMQNPFYGGFGFYGGQGYYQPYQIDYSSYQNPFEQNYTYESPHQYNIELFSTDVYPSQNNYFIDNTGQTYNFDNINNSVFNNLSYNIPQVKEYDFDLSNINKPEYNPFIKQTDNFYFKTQTVTEPKGKHNLAWWKAQGYDEEMGKKLGEDAQRYSKHDPHQCSGYTRRTLNRLYGTNFDNGGPAYLFGKNILSDPKLKGKFKKINVSGLKNGEFPEGAIVIWYPGSPGYTKSKAALYGHVAIAHNNKGYANGVVNNLSTYCEVWIPVKG